MRAPGQRREFERHLANWEPDYKHTKCPICLETSFGLLARLTTSDGGKHHCRTCGTIMCASCSKLLTATAAMDLIRAAEPPVPQRAELQPPTPGVCVRGGGASSTGPAPAPSQREALRAARQGMSSAPAAPPPRDGGDAATSPGGQAGGGPRPETGAKAGGAGARVQGFERPFTDDMVGQPVHVEGVGPGRVAYVGVVEFAKGADWVGVVLDAAAAEGVATSDGLVDGVRYFTCCPKKGHFGRQNSEVRLVTSCSHVPNIGSSTIRICTKCADGIDELSDTYTDLRAFQASRARCKFNPPTIIAHERQVRTFGDVLDQHLAPYIHMATQLHAREGLGEYDEAKRVLQILLAAMRGLGDLAGTIRAGSRGRGGKTNEHVLVNGTKTSLESRVIYAIKLRLESVPKRLLKLPTEEEVREAIEERRLAIAKDVGFDPARYLTVFENQRHVPGLGWNTGYRRVLTDPRPWTRCKKCAPDADEDLTTKLAQKFTYGLGYYGLDEVVPHPGHVWDGEWHVRYERADEDGWRYGSHWLQSAASFKDKQNIFLHGVRKRAWCRKQVRDVARDEQGHAFEASATNPAIAKSGTSAHIHTTRVQWVDDADVQKCMCCLASSFSLFNRKHHCRHCGRVVCTNCSLSQTYHVGMRKVVRTCDDCVFQATLVEQEDLQLAPTLGDDAEELAHVVAVIEQQRRYPLKGWSGSMLDRKQLTINDDTNGPGFASLADVPRAGGWHWQGEWEAVKHIEVDHEGWQYAIDWPRKFTKNRGLLDCVRQRTHTRRLVRTVPAEGARTKARSDTVTSNGARRARSRVVYPSPSAKPRGDDDDAFCG